MEFQELMQAGIHAVRKNRMLFILPLVLDIILYGSLAGSGISFLQLKLTLPSSLPSIINILPDAAKFSTESGFIIGYPGTLASGPFGFLFIFILLPLLTGGYIGTMVEHYDEKVQRTPFFVLAVRFWGRILMLRLLVLALFFILIPLFMLIPLIIILFFFLVLYFTVLFLFWEFGIVNSNLPLVAALTHANNVLKGSLGPIVGKLIPVFLIMAIFSLLASFFMNSVILFVVIALYSYVGAVIISGMLALYRDMTKESEEILE